MDEEEEWPETWDRNRVYMYVDPDGNKVPVPHGFTVSGAESEKYVNHNVEMRGTLNELAFTPGEKTWEHDESDTDKAWKLNEDGIWVSQNYHVANSEAKLISNEFTVGEDGGYLSIQFSVSSQSAYDLLIINLINCETNDTQNLIEIGGTELQNNYDNYSKELESGRYILSIDFIKNDTQNYGLDAGFIKNGTIVYYDKNGEDTIIVHKYGGFVIYEGNSEITDTNAFQESLSRNQFVWIPINDTSTIYETSTKTGKKKSKNSSDSDDRSEPGIIKTNYYGKNDDTIRNLKSTRIHDVYQLYKEIQHEFDYAMNSIEKYGGFYIARYEANLSNISNGKQISRNIGFASSGCSWYEGYEYSKKISNNNNIQTGIIFKQE